MTESSEPSTAWTPAPTRAIDVAERFLKIAGAMETTKLNALLYLAQSHHLAITDRPLFNDPIVARPEGPVVLTVHELHTGETVVSPGFYYERLRLLDQSPATTPSHRDV